jgi:hypothetical protein
MHELRGAGNDAKAAASARAIHSKPDFTGVLISDARPNLSYPRGIGRD